MKKGSSIIVIGDYSDNIYTNKNTGTPEIGREIRANSINYCLTGGSKKNEETENQTVVQTTPPPQPAQPAPMPVAETSAVQQDNPFDVSPQSDDLPF